jgi:hypothetical protein
MSHMNNESPGLIQRRVQHRPTKRSSGQALPTAEYER